MARRILIATTNPGKMREISTMLDADAEWVGLADLAPIEEVDEDGATFAENARKKATEYAMATGLWTLADDSGLVIDALDGAPGVNSARFSGEKLAGEDRELIDHRNIKKVLELLKGVPREKRTTRFVCSLCLATPDKVLAEVQGTFEGIITEEEFGEEGFGYDPIFFVPGLGKTISQISHEEKNAISHRGEAIRNLKPLLDELLKLK